MRLVATNYCGQIRDSTGFMYVCMCVCVWECAYLTVDIEQRRKALMASQILGVARKVASMGRRNGFDGQHAAPTAHWIGADAQLLANRLTIQRPVDLQGQIAPRHGTVQR